MRTHRFKVASVGSEVVQIEGSEAAHALRVLRLSIGNEVVVFDGAGVEAAGVVVATGPGRLDVRVLSRRAARVSEGAATLALFVATPKGARADWLVEKCAELGVRRLVPIVTGRSSVRPGEGKLARWRRLAAAAAKQSGSPVVMNVAVPQTFEQALAGRPADARLYYGDGRAPRRIREATGEAAGEVWFFIGPEGGFTTQEAAALDRAGATAVRLSATTLRVETAAAAVAAAWAARF